MAKPVGDRWAQTSLEAAQPIILVEALTKRFGALAAVDGVSFEVRRGEVFGILGPNGAGKTTALECIEGLQRPTSGRTLVLGIDTAKEPERAKERIGVQLQASSYFEHLTLVEILELFGRMYLRRIAPKELLAKVGLSDKARSTVTKLSGGQKQRFSIAATLVNDPELVFLDEPTTGLDPQARRNLWELITALHREGRTVVLTTHYMEEAQELCQRVAIMDRGRIVALDTPTRLIHRLPVPYLVRLLTSTPLPPDQLERLEAVRSVQAGNDGYCLLASSDASKTLPALLMWLNGRGATVEHLEVITATLEDVFLALTGKQLRD
ncbi:MAG: ABC transporter ATP-binding protein [Chloroflexi bacterium]|nr:ABC transporter ATP-binding protein [Chloroflexota bacterium]